MDVYGPGYNGPKEVSYLFVDAGCLRATVQRISTIVFGHADGIKIAYLGLKQQHQKVFVYDALSAQERGEDQAAYERRIESRMVEIRAIRSLSGFHVQLGDLRGRVSRQKKVDVQIAVDMLLHTFRQNMHRATLLAGDIDFVPLLEALIREGMQVNLWHPEQAAGELMSASDETTPLSWATLAPALLRGDGTPLLNSWRVGYFNAGSRNAESWVHDGHQYELASLFSRRWMIRRGPSNGESLIGEDEDLNTLVGLAKLMHKIEVPPRVVQAAQYWASEEYDALAVEP